MGLLQERCAKYTLPQEFMSQGIYPYFREIEGKQGTEVMMDGHRVLMFGSNAYLGLTYDRRIMDAAIAATAPSAAAVATWRIFFVRQSPATKIPFAPVTQDSSALA